jgi:hypothetical protein
MSEKRPTQNASNVEEEYESAMNSDEHLSLKLALKIEEEEKKQEKRMNAL